MEPHRRQFLQTQGPVAREESRKATQILRAGNIARPNKYAFPVMGSGADSPCQGEMSRSDRGGRVAVLWARSARRPRPPAILWVLSQRADLQCKCNSEEKE